jgi:hypothetical protein
LQLKANVLGTEFLLRGKGGDPSLHKGFNAQLLAVNYKPTINHVKAGPRTMTACVPVPEAKQVCTCSLRVASNILQLVLPQARHEAIGSLAYWQLIVQQQ